MPSQIFYQLSLKNIRGAPSLLPLPLQFLFTFQQLCQMTSPKFTLSPHRPLWFLFFNAFPLSVRYFVDELSVPLSQLEYYRFWKRGQMEHWKSTHLSSQARGGKKAVNIHTLSFVLCWYLESPPQAEGGHVPDAISWPWNRPPNNLKLTIPSICEIAPCCTPAANGLIPP